MWEDKMSIQVQPISFGSLSKSKDISFGYTNELKTLFRKGLLPSVKVDAAGNKLTKKNVTLDHIIPKSKGGKSKTDNYMLATRKFNEARGNEPLSRWVTFEGIMRYLEQFVGVRVGDFRGNKYIESVLKTLDRANKRGL